MIKLVRCDDRLIHGQCVVKLVSHYSVEKIIVIDEFTATNPVMKRIFQGAVPKNLTAVVVTAEESIAEIEKAMNDNISTIVLMRSPDIMPEIFEKVPDLQKDYNIASVPAQAGKKEITQYCYLDEKQLDAVKKMADSGVHIWFQLIPDSQKTEWDAIKNNF